MSLPETSGSYTGGAFPSWAVVGFSFIAKKLQSIILQLQKRTYTYWNLMRSNRTLKF